MIYPADQISVANFTLLFVSHDETLADFFEKKVSLEELNERSGIEQ